MSKSNNSSFHDYKAQAEDSSSAEEILSALDNNTVTLEGDEEAAAEEVI